MKPEIATTLGGYSFTWPDTKLIIKVSRVHVHRLGRVTGEVEILTTNPKYNPNKESKKQSILHPSSDLNFTAAMTRKHLAKTLTEQYPEWDWIEIINQLCHYVLELARKGEPVEELWTSDEVEPVEYLLEPFLLKNQPIVIFGEKESLKSTIAQLFCLCMVLPWTDNPLGLTVPTQPVHTLYLDWETDSWSIRRTMSKLAKGLGIGTIQFKHRRCALPLGDDLEQIINHIADIKAEAVIIDSLGAAAGGDELQKSGPAINFYSALRQLKVSSLIIGQTSKDETKKKSIYGSTFFAYYARSVWEVVKAELTDKDEAQIALFHRWSNLTNHHEPFGFTFSFVGDDKITVERTPVSSREFMEHLGARTKIIELLKNGTLTTKEIMEELSLTRGNTDNTLKRLKDKGIVLKMGERWGLLAQEML